MDGIKAKPSDADRWMDIVKINPLLVACVRFAAFRDSTEDTSSVPGVLPLLFRRAREDDLELTGSEVMNKTSQIGKVIMSKFKQLKNAYFITVMSVLVDEGLYEEFSDFGLAILTVPV